MKKLEHGLMLLLLLLTTALSAQNANITGVLQGNAGKAADAARIRILGTNFSTQSAEDGSFKLEGVPQGDYQLEIIKGQYQPLTLELEVSGTADVDLGTITLIIADGIDMLSSEDLIPTISLSEEAVNSDGGGSSNVSGLLTSSRDVFYNTAAFAFGAARFRVRGYDSEHATVYINGLPMNSPENGWATWSLWGGLNDAMRSRENTVGLAPTDYTFGGIGGASQIDMRASTQWKQVRAGLAVSNRSYRLRPMFIYSTGLMDNGWAFSVSGSVRLAEQGPVPASYYSAASYYFAAEKRISRQHALNFMVFGAPRVRGKSAPITAEMQEIAREANGNGYLYNPYWGYQTQPDGSRKIRNSRYAETHIPTMMLTHDWNMNDRSKLTTSIGYQFGRNGSTALNWYNAPDPRPEYYRKWPSYVAQTDEAVAAALRQQFVDNPELMQMDWDGIYEINRNSFDEEFSGTEARAKYIVEERRFDMEQYNFNTIYRSFINDNITVNGGVRGQYYIGKNFKVIDDLLGADYYIDIDQFAERDSATNPVFAQNNLSDPYAQLRTGDRFGYDFEAHIQNAAVWGQGQFKYGKIEFFGAAELSYTRFWREGNLQNGRFPDNSLGKGEVFSTFNYNVKGGATYKLDGRNYFYLNGNYGTQAPFFRNAHVSARSRDQLVDGLTSMTVFGTEGGYLLKAPKAKARVTGYYTRFLNGFYNQSFFSDNAFAGEGGELQSGFVNFVMNGVDRRHMGLELAAQYEVLTGLNLQAVAAIGEHIYTSRPEISIYLDNDPNTQVASRTAYMKNSYVAGSPQMAYSFGINYRAPQYWFINVNFNYMMRSFVEVNPDRRTFEAVSYVNNPEFQQQAVTPGSAEWVAILEQEELPHVFTIDIFGGKSFRFKNSKGEAQYIYINVGISNILNNRNIITGGFEQLRYDFEDNNPNTFPTRYFYGYGINYFASVTYRI